MRKLKKKQKRITRNRRASRRVMIEFTGISMKLIKDFKTGVCGEVLRTVKAQGGTQGFFVKWVNNSTYISSDMMNEKYMGRNRYQVAGEGL